MSIAHVLQEDTVKEHMKNGSSFFGITSDSPLSLE